MKKLLLLIPVMALLAASCNSSEQTSVQTQPTPTPLATQQAAAPTVTPSPLATQSSQTSPTPSPTNNQVYVNSQYHFSVNIDKTWAGYKVVTGKDPFDKNVPSFTFEVPSSNTEFSAGTNYEKPFTIYVYPEREWTYRLSLDGPKPKIFKNTGTTVYAYDTWQANSPALDNLNLSGAINSFTIIK